MTRILRSLALRFPLLLGAIVLAVALVTGRLAQQELGVALLDEARQDLRGGAQGVADILARGIPAARAAQIRAVDSLGLRQAFALSSDEAAAQRLLERFVVEARSETRAAARLLRRDGTPLASWSRIEGATSMGWTVGMLREGVLPPDSAVFGPIVAIADSMPGFVVATPVRSQDGTVLGYLDEIHTARGTNVDQVLALADVERLLVGSRHWTVWSDLAKVVAGPEFTALPDSVQRIVSSDGVASFGVAREVPGTAWLVWVERPEAQVMAPVERFLRRMWLATLMIAFGGALLAWLLARLMASRIRHVATELDRTLTAHGTAEPPANGDSDATASDELRQLERAYAALEARVEQRRHLDEQLLQAQKLEAVGRLAGGIAHDFNNLLTVMASYAGMAHESLDPESPEAKDIGEVIKAVDRATALTRQLLAFSRQRISDTRHLDLNEVVSSTDSMLARLIPSNVERVIELTPHLPFVEADHTQLEQVLINLVVNAVDAMPEGGRLTVRTAEARATGLRGGDVAGAEERCVCLSVADTGVGMDAATLERIFDPFFTTKAIGKGTGLGLATVHGIVEALGGRVVAYSEPGKGTTMRMYLPIAQAKPRDGERLRSPLAVTAEPVPPGLVLLAEDDAATRTVIRRILESAGHRVEAHETADACLRWLRAREGEQLPMVVITDVMMPGLNGIAFTKLLREEYPQLPVILVSGYADVRDRMPEGLALRPVILEKPFTATALHDAMRRALRPSASGGQA